MGDYQITSSFNVIVEAAVFVLTSVCSCEMLLNYVDLNGTESFL